MNHRSFGIEWHVNEGKLRGWTSRCMAQRLGVKEVRYLVVRSHGLRRFANEHTSSVALGNGAGESLFTVVLHHPNVKILLLQTLDRRVA